MKNQFLVL